MTEDNKSMVLVVWMFGVAPIMWAIGAGVAYLIW